jgi:hypothetical protein
MGAQINDLPDITNGYDLYRFVQRQAAALPTADQFADRVMQEFSETWESPVSLHIRNHFRQLVSELYTYEQYSDIPPFPQNYREESLDGARYRDELVAVAFRIGSPQSTANVLQAIGTMVLTHLCDLIPPPFNEEVEMADAHIPAIHKMRAFPNLSISCWIILQTNRSEMRRTYFPGFSGRCEPTILKQLSNCARRQRTISASRRLSSS